MHKKNLRTGKSSGEDKILNEYIKSTEGIFLPTYEKLFNFVFDSGNIPNAWLEGVIIPIYKHKGDSNVAANCRPTRFRAVLVIFLNKTYIFFSTTWFSSKLR